MASSTNPDLWSGLSGFGFSESATPDMRAALLKVNAEMFVAAPARDRESIETFETLMLGSLPRADAATLLALARILAPCADAPASVLDYLVQHSPDARAVVLQHAAHPPETGNRRQIATPAGRLRLAARLDLDPATIRKLLLLGEEPVAEALAANPAVAPDTGSFKLLVQRARCRPTLARILLGRDDLSSSDAATLYLAADATRRAAIRDDIAALLARRRIALSCILTADDIAELLAVSRRGDVERLEALLSTFLCIPSWTKWRVLEVGRHRLLALALKALGMSRRDATQIFLSLHPALAYPLSAVRELVREVRDVPGPIALALVESVLGVRALSREHQA
ncbi:DUF2336 domain-containing protein [Microvirga arabica]|uniref:DUF2336 domain-containing protein n=1 Tax=Microvirga arabica TaxID=1128671 RepID=A0ABV6Y4Q2_9HYPH|nr:DUF2336 domain-containing protein [Microvirga arabica]MBM1170937.1 DUF2336 domain-containing protein [Microvirga arabica]